jgi:hypothetical protein
VLRRFDVMLPLRNISPAQVARFPHYLLQDSTFRCAPPHFTSATPHAFPDGVNPVRHAFALQTHCGAPFWRQHVHDDGAQLPPGVAFEGPQMQLPLLVAQPIQLHMHEPFVGYDGSAQQMTLAGSTPRDDGEHGRPLPGGLTAQLQLPFEARQTSDDGAFASAPHAAHAPSISTRPSADASPASDTDASSASSGARLSGSKPHTAAHDVTARSGAAARSARATVSAARITMTP